MPGRLTKPTGNSCVLLCKMLYARKRIQHGSDGASTVTASLIQLRVHLGKIDGADGRIKQNGTHRIGSGFFIDQGKHG